MSDASVPERKLARLKDVFLYYPQRVQVVVMAFLNLVFVVLETSFNYNVDSILVSVINAFAIAVLVFFYGEQKAISVEYVRDVVVPTARQEGANEANGS